MSSRKPIVAGNWKMNGSKGLINDIAAALNGQTFQADVIVFPPAMLIEQAANQGLTVGTQTVSEYEKGAYTETKRHLPNLLGQRIHWLDTQNAALFMAKATLMWQTSLVMLNSTV